MSKVTVENTSETIVHLMYGVDASTDPSGRRVESFLPGLHEHDRALVERLKKMPEHGPNFDEKVGGALRIHRGRAPEDAGLGES